MVLDKLWTGARHSKDSSPPAQATAAHLLPVPLGASPTPCADLGNDPVRKKSTSLTYSSSLPSRTILL